MRLFFTLFLIGNITIGFSQTKSWDGGGSNNNWHTTCNWNPDGVPACTDIVTIPTGNVVNIATGTIAHCEVLNLQGTADLNIQGTGKLEVSSNNSCVGTESSTSTGCTVPGSNWGGNGNNYAFFPCFSKYCICPCSNTGQDIRNRALTNNSSYTLTLSVGFSPGCGTISFVPSSVVAPGAGFTVRFTANYACCPTNGFHTINWTSSDGGSGSFTVETCNIL